MNEEDVKRKRGRPSKKIKLFQSKKINEETILRLINNEREIVKSLEKIEKLILNVTLVFKEKENGNIEAFYTIEIDEFKMNGKRGPKEKVFNLSEIFPSDFPIMDATVQDVKKIHFDTSFNLRSYIFDDKLEEITGKNIITRDYTLVKTNDIFKYFDK